MNDVSQEFERFITNAWQGRANGLWYMLVIGLGSQADEVQENILSVIRNWLLIAAPVHREYGFPCEREVFPAPEELKLRLPQWFMDDFAAYSEQQILESGWRYSYESWIWAMEERCWNWWGYERSGDLLTIQLQVDGWPCPTEELVYLARAAGAESVIVDDTVIYQLQGNGNNNCGG